MWAPLGRKPYRSTAAENAVAMGLDAEHMEFERVAQSIPPAYARYVFAQMCAAAANKWFGVPVITYDAMLEDPLTARRTLEAWLVGAGGESPTLGLRFQPAQAESEGEAPSRTENELPDAAAVGGGKALLSVEEARELYYSYAGDYDSLRVAVGSEWRLRELGAVGRSAELDGHNTLIEIVDGEQVDQCRCSRGV